MKKLIALLMALVFIVAFFCACGESVTVGAAEQEQAENSGLSLHKIGVATYNVKDAQIRMFKDYLDGYIKACFEDVTFIYSDSISSSEDMMEFLQLCADNEVEGIMLFNSQDLKKEVEFCESKGMYIVRASGNVSEEIFRSVAANPYFLGEIGPGTQLEYNDAYTMTKVVNEEYGDSSYLIISSGASLGNEMHRLRTVAMLDALQIERGVKFSSSSEELALVTETTTLEADGLKVTIFPGYLELEENNNAAMALVETGEYQTILSAVPVTSMMDALQKTDVKCAVMDCFSEDNLFGFMKGKICYVAGKYQSEIGPAFAAIYNAVTGFADDFRDNGMAFRLHQGFWKAADQAEYNEKYSLACSATINAYNYDDLVSIIKAMNPDANFAQFRTLTERWSYEDCLARRAA